MTTRDSDKNTSEESGDAMITELLGRHPANAEAAMNWLADVWQYLVDGGLLVAGGPSGQASVSRLQLKDKVRAVSRAINTPEVNAEANRITAHVLNASECYQEAIPYYSQAIAGLESVGQEGAAIRNRLGFSAALQMTGAYQEALDVLAVADRWFVQQGDENYHARVLINTGIIHHRLDEHAKAVECHLEAARIFERCGQEHDWAIASLNIANSYAFLDEFEQSDSMYQRAEEIATEHGLSTLADQARYNRAYLFFLRGRYSDAIISFNELRQRFAATNSTRHAALCDLDQSEIYLQLNLAAEAAILADQATLAFRQLGMRYEEAKAITYLGVAETRQHRYGEALEIFQEAGRMFAVEDNAFWKGMVELYRAEVLLLLGRYWEARFLAQDALTRFEALDIASQKGMALVLSGRTAMATNREQDLHQIAENLLDLTSNNQVPLLKFPAHMLMGQIAEQSGQRWEARQHYATAAAAIEEHRGYLHHDELRVRFLEGKETVYESLVRLDLEDDIQDEIAAFDWCERAKSRALADLLGQHLPSLHTQADPELLDHVQHLREELNSQYVRSRPDAGEFAAPVAPERMAQTEQALERGLRQLSAVDANFGALFGTTPRLLGDIQQALPTDTTLVEFFVTRGEVLAFVLGKTTLRVYRRLASIQKIQHLRQGLDFQMQKFALGPDYVTNHQEQMLQASRNYLERLFNDLASRWIDDVTTANVIIVPHGELHALPFHAFFDGQQYLTDRFRIYYAPSAGVFCHTAGKPGQAAAPGLLVGQADDQAPAIDSEIENLQTLMPESRILAGAEATRSAFFEAAADARFIHISTHSFFRKENPVFSGFHLRDGPVTALDLYSQSWSSELVTMSGCSSGAAQVTGGDDLVGLVRGVFHAGARAMLMSLWNVSDDATACLIEAFYREWLRGHDKPRALQIAMREVRAQYRHPFYWAPFVLVGSP